MVYMRMGQDDGTASTHSSSAQKYNFRLQQPFQLPASTYILYQRSFANSTNLLTTRFQHHQQTIHQFKMQFSTIFIAVAAMTTGFIAARPIPIIIPANAHAQHARSLDVADLWVVRSPLAPRPVSH